MCAVSSATLVGSLVDLDVLDDEVAGVKTLGIGIGFSVLKETENEFGGLDGPSTLGGAELLG